MTSIDRSQPSYFSKYRNIRFERSEDGILVMSLHNDGRPLTFTAQDHESFVDAFYDVARDRDRDEPARQAGGHASQHAHPLRAADQRATGSRGRIRPGARGRFCRRAGQERPDEGKRVTSQC